MRYLFDLVFITRELVPSTWPDFERLLSKQGSCWCMWYHRPYSREQEMKKYRVTKSELPSHNKKRKKELVAQGRSHGIIVYSDSRPVGWCQYGPKDELPQIDRGRFYRKLDLKDDGRLWRVTCFFVDKGYRRRGVAPVALQAALASIRKKGGGIVEAYPRASKHGGSVSLWFGTVGMFKREGFKPVSPLGGSVLMRKAIPSVGRARSDRAASR